MGGLGVDPHDSYNQVYVICPTICLYMSSLNTW